MEQTPLVIRPDDPVIPTLAFRPYRSTVERCFKQFLPTHEEPQTLDVRTPWGEELTAKSGDYLVCEKENPKDIWPVDREIFEQTYLIIREGVCIKRAITMLVPLVDLTGGDPDRQVTIHTMEGSETVRAGDFYLARGVKGEIWAYPKDKIGKTMIPAE